MFAALGRGVHPVCDGVDDIIESARREDFPSHACNSGQFFVRQIGIEDVAITELLLKQVDGKEQVVAEVGVLLVKNGVDSGLETNPICDLGHNRQIDVPIARRFETSLVDITVHISGVIAFVGVSKVGSLPRVSLLDFREVLENPDDAIAIPASVEALKAIGCDQVRHLNSAVVERDTKLAEYIAGDVCLGGIYDGSNFDMLRVGAAKFLLDIVRNPYEVNVFFHIFIVKCLIYKLEEHQVTGETGKKEYCCNSTPHPPYLPVSF